MVGTNGLSYMTAEISNAQQQIMTAAQQTDHNYHASINVLNTSPEVFGGKGQAAYAQALDLINAAYSRSQQAIAQAGYALGMANDGIMQCDAQLASQYPYGT